ncbi:MAG TPA: chemotaxis response regulator protein-glutamate methylesterase [Kineosporiaceae bacterium]|nr:chemotaxis response regulator protein-glutamate methylesterase [Kineosporiaceae bacterium]
MSARAEIQVLIVDDSAVVRQVLTAVLDREPGIHVSGTAADPIFAMERMNRDWPDVVILDVEMPRMDGITFLKKLMSVRPTPVVICSTLTERGAETTMQAMVAGAVGFVTKPKSGLKSFLEGDAGEIVQAVRSAAAGDIRRVKAASVALASGSITSKNRPTVGAQNAGAARTGANGVRPARVSTGLPVTTDRLIAIGTSTGGTQALEIVLSSLPRVAPGIVVVQHMPPMFTAAFADRLNLVCEAEVLEASDGDRVLPGRVLIAPGGLHMTVHRDGAQYRVRIADGPRVNRHKPSVDILFESVARSAGRNALGVIMTGMGDDGARGLLQMRAAGARTIGQDQATCVVYGMPAAAQKLGAVDVEVPLNSIAAQIEQFAGVR